jgi:hypothetical protein
MELAENVATTTKTWGTSFPCLRLNSTCEFVDWEAKLNMTYLNFVASSQLSLKASTTNFESNSKSMLSKCISLIHCLQAPPPPGCILHHRYWYLKAIMNPYCYQSPLNNNKNTCNLIFNGCFHLQLNLISSFSFTFSLFFHFCATNKLKIVYPL